MTFLACVKEAMTITSKDMVVALSVVTTDPPIEVSPTEVVEVEAEVEEVSVWLIKCCGTFFEMIPWS